MWPCVYVLESRLSQKAEISGLVIVCNSIKLSWFRTNLQGLQNKNITRSQHPSLNIHSGEQTLSHTFTLALRTPYKINTLSTHALPDPILNLSQTPTSHRRCRTHNFPLPYVNTVQTNSQLPWDILKFIWLSCWLPRCCRSPIEGIMGL